MASKNPLACCVNTYSGKGFIINLNLDFARVGGFHLQAEPLTAIRSDASSRAAGQDSGLILEDR